MPVTNPLGEQGPMPLQELQLDKGRFFTATLLTEAPKRTGFQTHSLHVNVCGNAIKFLPRIPTQKN